MIGVFNLGIRGAGLAELTDLSWWHSDFGSAVALKLGLFALIVGVSAAHDFVVGPRATTLMASHPDGPEARRMRRLASVLGRINGRLALLILGAAVILVRGWPE